MSKPRVVTSDELDQVQTQIIPEGYYPPDADQIPDDISLLNVIAELGGDGMDDAKVNVYRQDEKNPHKGAFLFTCAPGDFSLETIRDSYGGGRYRVHARASGKVVTNRVIQIEEPKRGIPGATMQNQSAPSVDLAKMIEAMQAGFNGLGQLIMQKQTPAVDPDAMRSNLLRDLSMMRELLGNNQPRVDSSETAMTMFLKGIEVAKSITPREGEAGTVDLIMEGLKTFGPVIAEATKNKMESAATMPSATPLPLPTPHQPSQAFSQPQPIGNDDMMKQYAAMLHGLALADKDPYVYAGLLCDNVPESEIRTIISRPNVKQFLFDLNPALESPDLQPWLDEFIAAINDILTPGSEGDSVQEPQANGVPGNATIAGDNSGE